MLSGLTPRSSTRLPTGRHPDAGKASQAWQRVSTGSSTRGMKFYVAAAEFRELDAERVLVLPDVRGRGKGSRLEIGQIPGMGAYIFELHGGRVTRHVVYFDRDRAIAELGLTPEGDV